MALFFRKPVIPGSPMVRVWVDFPREGFSYDANMEGEFILVPNWFFSGRAEFVVSEDEARPITTLKWRER